MKRSTMKRITALLWILALSLCLCACGTKSGAPDTDSGTGTGSAAESAPASPDSDGEPVTVYKVGICAYADNACLNQIVDSLRTRLGELGTEHGVQFQITSENCNGDQAVLARILSNFIADGVDLMVGVSTPVAVQMRVATEERSIPVVFAAVSDPERSKLVASLDEPGGSLTGTSDALNVDAMLNLLFALKPDAAKIGFLYDQGEASSSAAIETARTRLQDRQAGIVERVGSSVDEIVLAAQALAADGVDAVFSPTDDTILQAEPAIGEIFAEAGVPHFAGADVFAMNGAFLGFGADYAKLGAETANMVSAILADGADPAALPVRTIDSKIAAVNTEVCAALGLDYAAVEAALAPLCGEVRAVTPAESGGDLNDGDLAE